MWARIKANPIVFFIVLVLVICAICWITKSNVHLDAGSNGVHGGVERGK